MNILAVDTAGKTAGVALLQDDRLLYEVYLDGGMTHSETLMPLVDHCLKLCGLTERPTRVILGGPLTGTATEDLRNEKVELSTTAVLAIRDDKHEYSYTCIGCGRCTAVCPQGLNPMRILQELRRGNRRAVEELGIEDCTQCTCCSYICPSRQSVAGEILLYRQKMKGGEEP